LIEQKVLNKNDTILKIVVKDNYKKYIQLRKDYKFLVYEGFAISENPENLTVLYQFNLADKYYFSPSIKFKKGKYFNANLSASIIENFVFHIGLIELISYWKAACPPKIIIKPFQLDELQVKWWKNMWYNGLGEFFYLNKIEVKPDNFVEVISDSEKVIGPVNLNMNKKQVLIPIGGGKDSIVTLELLKDHFNCIPLIINPRKASLESIRLAGYGLNDYVEIQRTIHPQLLQLNKLGFLNGHTPFSALLAFISVFSAYLTGSNTIALSNESSANEPTNIDTGVNHQYSKSFAFEKDFRNYMKMYISPDINYFSFLRPLKEYDIARLFAGYPKYFSAFKSCNAGSKTDSWCGNCPKCLFTFIILSPFVAKDTLVELFGKDLLNDEKLLTYFDELTGLSEIKPFECVGTIDEVNYALIRTFENRSDMLPYLLNYYISTPAYARYKDFKIGRLEQTDDKDHFLEIEFLKILKKSLNE
jgi:hypothetical protein